MGIKRPETAAGTGKEVNPGECNLAIGNPSLWEFLVERSYEDGSKRQPGTMMVFTEDGWFKMMLNDKDNARIAFVAGDTLENVLGAADLGLRDGKLDWRKSKPFKRGG